MQNNEKFSLFANDVNAPVKVELHDDGQYFVSARELHAFLGSQAQFTNWADRMFEYGFIEGKDYFEVYNKNVINPKGGRPSIDYWLTFRCAQHIGMLQKSKQGTIIRDYFIGCEDRLQQVQALIIQVREETLSAEIKKPASRVEDIEQKYQWLLDVHKDLAESVKDILEEMPHAQVLFEILLERTHKLEMSREVLELKNTLFSKMHLLQGRVQELEKALKLHTKHFVYIFYNVMTDEYRIGKANILDKRHRQLHTVEQDIRQYLAIATRNAREALLLERYLQTYFGDKRTQGDWYKLNEEDLKMLALFVLLHETV